jgi:hypothetical protein
MQDSTENHPVPDSATDARDIYVGDFDVAPVGSKWAVMHRPSGMVAPADMTCSWLAWAEGRAALAYYGSRVEAREWFSRAAGAK